MQSSQADPRVGPRAVTLCRCCSHRLIDPARLNIRGEELLTKTTHWVRSNRQRDAEENRVYKGRGETETSQYFAVKRHSQQIL